MDSISSKSIIPDSISRRMGVAVQRPPYHLSDSDLEALFELARKFDGSSKKESIIESQSRIYNALRKYPGEDSEYILEGALKSLSGEGISKTTTSINIGNREPVRLAESLWLCDSYDLPNCIREKVDKSWKGLYLLDTRLIDPDDRFNSDGVVRLFPRQELKISELKESQISPQSRFEVGHKVLTPTNSYSAVMVSEQINTPVVAAPKPKEKTPLEKAGLTLQGVLSPLKEQLQDPNITNEKLEQEFKKAENLLVGALSVRSDEFKEELILTMKDYVSSPETSIDSLENRQRFFLQRNMEELFIDCISDRVHNDIMVKGAVGKEELNLIRAFNLNIKNPIYKDFLFNRAIENFEFDLRNDSYTKVEESVRLASKFLVEAIEDAKNAGAANKELGKALYSKLLEVANSPNISSLTLEKCRLFGKRLGVLDRMPDFTGVISPAVVQPLDKKVDLTPQVLAPEPDKLDVKPEQSSEVRVKEPEAVTSINEPKFPFSYDSLIDCTPAEVARGISDAYGDELLAILFDEGSDKRVVQLLDCISSGNPLSVALRKSNYGDNLSLAQQHLKGFLRANKSDPNLSKIILAPDIKQVRESEIKCPPENLFELVDEHGNVNLRGHLTSLATEVEGVNLVYEENKLVGMEVDDYRIKEKNELSSQQGCLNKVIKMVQVGDLIVYGSKKNNGLIKLEVEYIEKGEKTFLACLHPSTNSRIWGIYTPHDGKMVFKGICADHDEWGAVINSFKRKEGSKVVA